MNPPRGERAAVAAAAALVGDRWTLQLIHVLLDGPRRFGELRREVAPIATNVLAHRLKTLEGAGLVLATPYQERPRRFSYELSEAGHELRGVLRLLAAWTDETLAPVDPGCGTPLEVRWFCPACERVVEGGDEPLVRL